MAELRATVGEYKVYVPPPAEPVDSAIAEIAPGSAIVGTPDWGTIPYEVARLKEPARIHIAYEGNVYGAVNLHTFEERLRQAADVLLFGFATTAQKYVPETCLHEVGWYDAANRLLFVDEEQRALLTEWIARYRGGR